MGKDSGRSQALGRANLKSYTNFRYVTLDLLTCSSKEIDTRRELRT
jgi:hypothetical protein